MKDAMWVSLGSDVTPSQKRSLPAETTMTVTSQPSLSLWRCRALVSLLNLANMTFYGSNDERKKERYNVGTDGETKKDSKGIVRVEITPPPEEEQKPKNKRTALSIPVETTMRVTSQPSLSL